MKKSICIETIGTQVDFYDRFALVAESGFDTVEFWGWADKDLEKVKRAAAAAHLNIAAFSGDAAYSLCDDADAENYIAFMQKSIEAARFLGCPVLVIHSNALGDGGVVLDAYPQYSEKRKYMNMLKTLLRLAPIAEEAGIVLVLEALNTLYDHAGNALFNTNDAAELTRLVGSPFVKILYDIYHMHIMHGDIVNTIINNIDQIAHVHVADVPGRAEPGTGEIRYERVLQQLTDSGYKGAVGFELFPQHDYEKAIAAIRAL